jgi:hypothetical protein
VLVPFLSHYRPLWVAFGITAGYLALAVYLSERIRSRIGYANWHRLHMLAFVVWGASIVHGLGAGSDTRSPWALALYAASALLVGGLLALRLRPSARRASAPAAPAGQVLATSVARPARAAASPAAVHPAATMAFSPALGRPTAGPARAAAPAHPAVPARRSRPSLKPLLAIPLALVAAVTVAWTAQGPLAAGWSTAAGGLPAHAADPTPLPSPTAAPVTPIGLPFQARLAGTVTQEGNQTSGTVVVAATFSGAVAGRLDLRIPLSGGGSGAAPMTLTVQPTGATCDGELQYADGQEFGGTCSLPDGKVLQLQMRMGLDQAGNLVGLIQVDRQA